MADAACTQLLQELIFQFLVTTLAQLLRSNFLDDLRRARRSRISHYSRNGIPVIFIQTSPLAHLTQRHNVVTPFYNVVTMFLIHFTTTQQCTLKQLFSFRGALVGWSFIGGCPLAHVLAEDWEP